MADSSAGLSNGAQTLPFTEISWTSSDGDIPSGVFNGGSQRIVQFTASAVLQSHLKFVYGNTLDASTGTYRGRVTYTLIMP